VHLAVLPFDCSPDELGTVAVCEGLLDTLTARLTALRRYDATLSVVPMSEVRALKIRSASDAHRVFGVDLVLTGSVQHDREQLRVPLQLIDAAALRQTGSSIITTDRSGDFILQDEVVSAVEDLLEIELTAPARRALDAGGTSDAEAAEYFLQARGTVTAVPTEDTLTRAMALYRSALERDPRFADAMVELAHLCLDRYRLNNDPIWLDHGLSYALRAVDLDPDLPGGHLAAGRCELARRDYPSAVTRFERAIELDPLELGAYTDLAVAYEESGEDESASATIERAVRTGPDDWQTHYTIGRFYLFDRGDPARAAKSFRRLVELNPDSAIGYAALGAALFYVDDRAAARANLERAVEGGDLYWALANLATLEFYEGNFRVAAQHYERALAIDDTDFQVWNNLAEARRAGGANDEEVRLAYTRAAEIASDRLQKDPDDQSLLINLASFAVHLDQNESAREFLDRVEELGVSSPELMFFTADAYERLGERERALRWVGLALGAGYPPAILEDYEGFADLRADPRFVAMADAATGD
jgi:tetratricopeptide (TPR) repeat protein